MASAANLDFSMTPRKNVIFDWMGDIKVRDDKTYSEKFYNVLLMTMTNLGYKHLNQKNQTLLAQSVLDRESYLAGYNGALVKSATLHKIWLKYTNAKRLAPETVADVLHNKKGENRIVYVEKLNKSFPTFLHECFRHATNTLGYTDTTKNMCSVMNKYAASTYPDCPIRGTLKMTKHHF